jgi:hypothetical protein
VKRVEKRWLLEGYDEEVSEAVAVARWVIAPEEGTLVSWWRRFWSGVSVKGEGVRCRVLEARGRRCGW